MDILESKFGVKLDLIVDPSNSFVCHDISLNSGWREGKERWWVFGDWEPSEDDVIKDLWVLYRCFRNKKEKETYWGSKVADLWNQVEVIMEKWYGEKMACLPEKTEDVFWWDRSLFQKSVTLDAWLPTNDTIWKDVLELNSRWWMMEHASPANELVFWDKMEDIMLKWMYLTLPGTYILIFHFLKIFLFFFSYFFVISFSPIRWRRMCSAKFINGFIQWRWRMIWIMNSRWM